MPLAVRLRLRNAATSQEVTHEGARLSARDLEAVRRAVEAGTELGELALAVVAERLLGATLKSEVPNGRHRAVVEVSRNGGEWEVVINGTVVAEDTDHGRAYFRDEVYVRDWGVTVRQAALDDAWAALDAVRLPDLAAAAVAAGEHEDVDWLRAVGGVTGTETEDVTARMWPLVALASRAIATAGLSLQGALPVAYPYERVWANASGVRYLSRAEPLVCFGRVQLAGAPPALYGDHPTMPDWSAAELLAEWQGSQRLSVEASYAAWPSSTVLLTVRDPWALRDPQAAAALPAVDAAVADDWRWRTEPRVADGQAIQDFALHYDGGVDGSGIGDVYPVPAAAAYAASRVSLTGTAPEREVANEDPMELGWKLAPVDSAAGYDDPFGGHPTDVYIGKPVFPVEESYLGASPPQDGDASVVRIVALERELGNAANPLRAVERREADLPEPGEPVESGGLWASELYRRHALAAGDVDVVVVRLAASALDAASVVPGDPAAGVSFQGLDWVVREVARLPRTEELRLTLVRPSAGWAAASAPDLRSGVETPGRPAPVMTRGTLGGGPGLWTCSFEATVPPAAVAFEAIQFSFDPAWGAGGLPGFTVRPGPGARSATAEAEEATDLYDTHPYAGQQARARAVYPGGYATPWSAWVEAT